MRLTSLKVSILVFSVAALAMVPMASATSFTFDLSSNNLGINANIGTVTFADAGANAVTVTITMNAGFSVKLQGGDVALSGPSGLALAGVSGLTGFSGNQTFSGLSFKNFKTSQNISQFGTFAFDFANVSGSPHGVVSVDSLSFTLTASGLKASQFTGIALHFCTASGTNCGPNTGYVVGTPSAPSTVPEPGTLGLVGTGLVGLAGIVRRRLRL